MSESLVSRNELVRRAAAYIAEERTAHPEKSLSALLDEAGEHLFEIGKLIAEKIPRQRAGDGIHLVKVHVFPHHQKIRPHHAAQAEAAVQHPRDALHRFRRGAGKIGGKLGSVFLSPAQVLVAEGEKFVLRFRFLAGHTPQSDYMERSWKKPPGLIHGCPDLRNIRDPHRICICT